MPIFSKKEKNNNSPIPHYIERFKSLLSVRLPFYGEILSRIEFIRDDHVSTIGTNGKVIVYNDSFMRNTPISERNYIVMHELMHIILKHWKRNDGKDPKIWNLAADYVVNGILDAHFLFTVIKDLEFSSPAGRLHIDENDEPAETLYYKILEDPAKYKDDLRSLLRDICFVKALTAEEEEMWEAELNDIIANSVYKHYSKNGWCIPQYCLSLVVSRLLPWKTILKTYLRAHETEDISYTTPERKYIHMDMILPGYGKDEEVKLQNVWAFVDVSGSVSNDEINEFITQLFTISVTFKANLNIVYWHSHIANVYRDVRQEDLCSTVPTSSGGTYPECIYAFLDENKIDPTVMLILTDGEFGTVDESLIGRRNKKTILVISRDGCSLHSDMGKVTRLY